MRLIDADKLKVYLKEYLHYDHAIPWVDAQPTAYDVEKVVAELGKMPTYEFGVTLMNTTKYLKKKDVLRVVGGKE